MLSQLVQRICPALVTTIVNNEALTTHLVKTNPNCMRLVFFHVRMAVLLEPRLLAIDASLSLSLSIELRLLQHSLQFSFAFSIDFLRNKSAEYVLLALIDICSKTEMSNVH